MKCKCNECDYIDVCDFKETILKADYIFNKPTRYSKIKWLNACPAFMATAGFKKNRAERLEETQKSNRIYNRRAKRAVDSPAYNQRERVLGHCLAIAG